MLIFENKNYIWMFWLIHHLGRFNLYFFQNFYLFIYQLFYLCIYFLDLFFLSNPSQCLCVFRTLQNDAFVKTHRSAYISQTEWIHVWGCLFVQNITLLHYADVFLFQASLCLNVSFDFLEHKANRSSGSITTKANIRVVVH